MRMITELDPHPSVVAPEPFAGADHPMRKVTRQVAFDGGWDAERAAKIGALFDSMAEGWASEFVEPSKAVPVSDALERGGLDLGGRWLELGSGTGAATRLVAPVVADLVACDLAAKMLAHAPGELAPRIQACASTLPFGDDTFDVVLMMNMLLFPTEVDRVLAPGGAVVWINTLGDQTPIHLPVCDVVEVLPGDWTAVTAMAGTGFWAVLRRR